MIKRVEEIIFKHRHLTVTLFALTTLVLGWFAAKTHVDASFNKQLPSDHEYIRNFKKYQEQFGGANRVVIALMARHGDTLDRIVLIESSHDPPSSSPGTGPDATRPATPLPPVPARNRWMPKSPS